MSKKEERILLKIGDVADLLSISKASVRRLVDRGELQAVRKLRHLLITSESVRRFGGLGSATSEKNALPVRDR